MFSFSFQKSLFVSLETIHFLFSSSKARFGNFATRLIKLKPFRPVSYTFPFLSFLLSIATKHSSSLPDEHFKVYFQLGEVLFKLS